MTERKRLFVVLFTIALSVAGVVAVRDKAWSDGRTATALDGLNLCLLAGYALICRDKGFARLLVFGAAFGVSELIADALCVQGTGTLDYSAAHSARLLLSPWWMPGAWCVVAVQIGYVGASLMARLGTRTGVVLTALLGAVNIPFYEEMAWHAHWWSYRNCRMIGHTPLYIILSELLIGAALGPLARASMQSRTAFDAVKWGILGGAVAIIAGILGYGMVEKLRL